MRFSFDTSALIEPWTRRYPPDIFWPLWEWLEHLINEDVVTAIDEVKLEINRQDDELTAWTKAQSKLFVSPNTDVQEALRTVLSMFPNLADYERDRSGPDPWVVAHALASGLSVVTYETMGKAHKPKIPNACAHFGIPCVSLVDVLRQTGYKS
jgi:hypothetical protein